MGKHSMQHPNTHRPLIWVGGLIIIVLLVGGGIAVHNGGFNSLFGQQKVEKSKPKPKPVHLTAYEKKVAARYDLSPAATVRAHKAPVTAIGDSVMVDIIPELRQVFPKVHVNGAVGRQFYDLPGITKTLKAQGKLADNVVVNLGTNGPPEKNDINSFLKTVGDNRQVYWINTHVPTQKWEHQTNQLIEETAKAHDNVHVVDWHALSQKHPKWFTADSVHLQKPGAITYVGLLAKTMA